MKKEKYVRDSTPAFVSFLSSAFMYMVGLFIAGLLSILRLTRIWKVHGTENLPTLTEKGNRGLIMVSNHVSLLEPIALIGLFARWYVFDMKYGPWNIAETANFRRGLFRLLDGRIIFVNRKDKESKRIGYLRAKKLLRDGAVFIIFPEGGRTYKGKNEELISDGGKEGAELNGKIRPFAKGAGLLALETEAMVIPVWVEGTDKVSPNMHVARYPLLRLWKPVKIFIGKPIIFAENVSAETATHDLERAVLGAKCS